MAAFYVGVSLLALVWLLVRLVVEKPNCQDNQLELYKLELKNYWGGNAVLLFLVLVFAAFSLLAEIAQQGGS